METVKSSSFSDWADQATAAYTRAKEIATEKAELASRTINREMRIASLTQERKRLIYALGEQVYSRVRGETNEPYVVQIERIDKEIDALKKQ